MIFDLNSKYTLKGRLELIRFLKHLGLALLQITTGPLIFSPAAMTKKAIVSLVLDFLPHLA